jgi:large subunit GTPase 1
LPCLWRAVGRGYFTAGQGNPDESRAARPILKDYVNGKLLYAHPPPGKSADAFNSENRDMERLRRLEKVKAKRAPVTRVGKNADTFVPTSTDRSARRPVHATALDQKFFSDLAAQSVPRFKGNASGPGGARVQMYAGQKSTGPDGLPLEQVRDLNLGEGKKHFKSGKRACVE